MTPSFTLLTLPSCGPCKAMKNMLEAIQYEDNIQLRFDYEIINIERRDDLVKEYEVDGVPVLISPTGKTLRHLLSRDRLRAWLQEEISILNDNL